VIDFRYHVVSIIAVYLALALCLVHGSTVVDNYVLQGTKKTANTLQQRNSELRKELLALQSQERSSESFVTTMAPKILANELTDKRVVVVEAPGADEDQTEKVADGIKQAGGSVTGTIRLDDSYVQKKQVGVLGGLTETLAEATKLEVPADAAPPERSAYLLANALVTKDKDKLGKSDDISTGVLEAYQEAKFLSTSGKPAERASLAVVVGPAKKYAPEDAAAGNTAVVQIAKYLDKTGEGTVLTAPTDSAGAEGVVSALRGDDDVKKAVSTVDNLDAPPGYVVSVLALALDGNGKPGQWGSGTGADNAAPTPAAAASKSP